MSTSNRGPLPPSPIVANSAQIVARPNPLQMMLHVGKTARLTGALMSDRRVSIFRKLFFILSILVLVALLFAGDAVTELMANVLPVLGPLVGLPADATLDWIAIAVVAYNLLRVFPVDIVGEHYDRLFRARPKVQPAQQLSAPANRPLR